MVLSTFLFAAIILSSSWSESSGLSLDLVAKAKTSTPPASDASSRSTSVGNELALSQTTLTIPKAMVVNIGLHPRPEFVAHDRMLPLSDARVHLASDNTVTTKHNNAGLLFEATSRNVPFDKMIMEARVSETPSVALNVQQSNLGASPAPSPIFDVNALFETMAPGDPSSVSPTVATSRSPMTVGISFPQAPTVPLVQTTAERTLFPVADSAMPSSSPSMMVSKPGTVVVAPIGPFVQSSAPIELSSAVPISQSITVSDAPSNTPTLPRPSIIPVIRFTSPPTIAGTTSTPVALTGTGTVTFATSAPAISDGNPTGTPTTLVATPSNSYTVAPTIAVTTPITKTAAPSVASTTTKPQTTGSPSIQSPVLGTVAHSTSPTVETSQPAPGLTTAPVTATIAPSTPSFTNVPTSHATFVPSFSTLESATVAPTVATSIATSQPTIASSTNSPTSVPTVATTLAPTTSPTFVPTVETLPPSVSPTDAPTVESLPPTKRPTKAPKINSPQTSDCTSSRHRERHHSDCTAHGSHSHHSRGSHRVRPTKAPVIAKTVSPSTAAPKPQALRGHGGKPVHRHDKKPKKMMMKNRHYREWW